ncbi:MAG: hypothetical protein ABI599_14700 [Flavobacteriales bacterium]
MARWIQLGFAGVFVFAAIANKEPIAWAAAAYFGIQAVFNVGCCATSSCASPSPTKVSSAAAPDGITFEEIT